MSVSCVVKKGYIYYPQFKLRKCFYESFSLDKEFSK